METTVPPWLRDSFQRIQAATAMDSIPYLTLAGTIMSTVILGLAYTYLTTTISFQRAKGPKQTPARPPLLPYTIPLLGSTIAFSSQQIGHFYETTLRRLALPALAIILAGKRTTFILTPKAVSLLFTSKALSRNELDVQLGMTVLGMNEQESRRAFVDSGPPEPTAGTNGGSEEKQPFSLAKLHAETLLAAPAVQALTSKYMQVLRAALQNDPQLPSPGAEVQTEAYAWLWRHVFRASTTALLGTTLLELYPDFATDYRVWEDSLLALLFGVPRFVDPAAYRSRDACLDKLEKWIEHNEKSFIPTGASEGGDWEPYFGSRFVRGRHAFARRQGLSRRAQAGFHLISIGGIVSNATPATGWLLLHLLSPGSPSNFRAEVQEELQACSIRGVPGVDVAALAKQPLLNSAFHETLRLYVDLLVVRQVHTSTTLDGMLLTKGEMVMAPTWYPHRSAPIFTEPEQFVPDRFVVEDREAKGGKSFSTAGLSGKYFPFGGGHYMCPGRTFAKQEVLGTIAVLLQSYDVEFVEFVNGKGKSLGKDVKKGFPKIKNGYAGPQVVGIEGDVKVKIKRKI